MRTLAARRTSFGGAIALVVCLCRLASAQWTPAEQYWIQAGSSVYAYDGNGALVAQSGMVLPGGNYGAALNGDLRLWVSNHAPGGNTVSQFSPQGTLLGTYPGGGPVGAGESSVGPLAIDANDVVYVGDPRETQQGTITKLDSSGNPLGSFPIQGNGVRSLQIARDGTLWVLVAANPTVGYLQQYSTTGSLLNTFAPPIFGGPPTIASFGEFGDIALGGYPGPNDFVLLSGSGTLTVVSTGVNVATLAIAPDRRIWMSNGNSLYIYDQSGSPLGTVSAGAGTISHIGFDGNGNAWTTSYPPVVAPGTTTIRVRRYDNLQTFLGETVVAAASANGLTLNRGDPNGLLRARLVDPLGDLDTDSFSNFQEFLSGTNPLDPSSVPAGFTFLNPPMIGTTFHVVISVPNEPLSVYFSPWSLNPTPLPLAGILGGDPRSFPINFFDSANSALIDPLWALSTSPIPPGPQIFPDTIGVLDAAGMATVRINIPNIPALVGITLRGAFSSITFNPLSPRTISPRIDVTLL